MFKKKENIKIKRLEHLVNKYSGMLRYIESSNRIDDVITFKCTGTLIRGEISEINSTLKGLNDWQL